MFNRINQGMYWDRAWKLVEGCTPVSEGCAHCWSAKETHMRKNHPNDAIADRNCGLTTEEGGFNGAIRMREDNLDLPMAVKTPTAFAIWNDLFHEDVSMQFIDRVFGVMAACDRHVYFLLTKRPERMLSILSQWKDWQGWKRGNIWLGVTSENQEQADKRIPLLLQIPARNRYVSIEPMLGPVDLRFSAFNGADSFSSLEGLHWVICGGESGPGARPMHPSWVLELVDQCQAAGVPFFFKQWGEFGHESQIDFEASPGAALSSRNAMYHVWPGGSRSYRIGKTAAGRLLDGKEYLEVPKI